MTEIPEKIWAFLDGPMVGLFVSGGFTADGVEYTRSDHALALVAAAYEAAAQMFDKDADDLCGVSDEGYRMAKDDATRIRALTPADALAAQRARDAQTYRMAMEAAASMADCWYHNSGHVTPGEEIRAMPNPFEETDDE